MDFKGLGMMFLRRDFLDGSELERGLGLRNYNLNIVVNMKYMILMNQAPCRMHGQRFYAWLCEHQNTMFNAASLLNNKNFKRLICSLG